MSAAYSDSNAYDIFLLFENYNFNIHDLVKILQFEYNLSVWPNELLYVENYEDYINKINDFKINYCNKFKAVIQNSKLIINLMTDESYYPRLSEFFSFNDNLGKPVLTVIIDDNKPYKEKLYAFDAIYEFHKNRVNSGYDPLIWLDAEFDRLITDIELKLPKLLKVNS